MSLPLLLSLLLASAPASGGFQAHAIKASPFDGLRWSRDAPEVRIADVWYDPLAIDGIEVKAVLKLCDARWPGQRQKRFGEDLVEALDLLGWKGDLLVDLDLARLEDGERVRLEAVEMTRAKRDALRDAARASAPPARAPTVAGRPPCATSTPSRPACGSASPTSPCAAWTSRRS